MDANEIEKKIRSFECQRCNECCRQPGYVYLAEGETESMAAFMGLELYDFTDRYCEVVGRRRLVLKKQADESCVFLNESGCSIHAAKPGQCKDFPFRWRTERSFQYCQGLKKLFATSDAK